MKKNKVDKRTKDYKDWKKSQKHKKESIGLGDVVDTLTKKTGVKKAINKVIDDCGCEERKKKWNKISLFSINVKPRCLTSEEIEKWYKFRKEYDFKIKGITLTADKIKFIHKTYQDVFNVVVAEPCLNCSPKPVIHMLEHIDKLYNESK